MRTQHNYKPTTTIVSTLHSDSPHDSNGSGQHNTAHDQEATTTPNAMTNPAAIVLDAGISPSE